MNDLKNLPFIATKGSIARADSGEVKYTVEVPPHYSEYAFSVELNPFVKNSNGHGIRRRKSYGFK